MSSLLAPDAVEWLCMVRDELLHAILYRAKQEARLHRFEAEMDDHEERRTYGHATIRMLTEMQHDLLDAVDRACAHVRELRRKIESAFDEVLRIAAWDIWVERAGNRIPRQHLEAPHVCA